MSFQFTPDNSTTPSFQFAPDPEPQPTGRAFDTLVEQHPAVGIASDALLGPIGQEGNSILMAGQDPSQAQTAKQFASNGFFPFSNELQGARDTLADLAMGNTKPSNMVNDYYTNQSIRNMDMKDLKKQNPTTALLYGLAGSSAAAPLIPGGSELKGLQGLDWVKALGKDAVQYGFPTGAMYGAGNSNNPITSPAFLADTLLGGLFGTITYGGMKGGLDKLSTMGRKPIDNMNVIDRLAGGDIVSSPKQYKITVPGSMTNDYTDAVQEAHNQGIINKGDWGIKSPSVEKGKSLLDQKLGDFKDFYWKSRDLDLNTIQGDTRLKLNDLNNQINEAAKTGQPNNDLIQQQTNLSNFNKLLESGKEIQDKVQTSLDPAYREDMGPQVVKHGMSIARGKTDGWVGGSLKLGAAGARVASSLADKILANPPVASWMQTLFPSLQDNKLQNMQDKELHSHYIDINTALTSRDKAIKKYQLMQNGTFDPNDVPPQIQKEAANKTVSAKNTSMSTQDTLQQLGTGSLYGNVDNQVNNHYIPNPGDFLASNGLRNGSLTQNDIDTTQFKTPGNAIYDPSQNDPNIVQNYNNRNKL